MERWSVFLDFLSGPLWWTGKVILLIGAASGLALGLLFLFSPARMERLNGMLSRWISIRRVMRPLERPVDSDRLFYGAGRAVILVLALGALGVLVWLLLDYNRAAMLESFGADPVMAWLVDSLVIFVAIGNLLALVYIVLLIVAPEAAHRFEAKANYWFSTRQALRPLDEMRRGPDAFLLRHRRITGVFLVLASAYILFTLSRISL